MGALYEIEMWRRREAMSPVAFDEPESPEIVDAEMRLEAARCAERRAWTELRHTLRKAQKRDKRRQG